MLRGPPAFSVKTVSGSNLSMNQARPLDVNAPLLLVVPSVGAVKEKDGYFLDRKFVDGMAQYRAEWGGPVRALMPPARRENLPFGRDYTSEELPFEVRLLPDAAWSGNPAGLMEGAAVALLSADDHAQLDLGARLAGAGPLIVYVIEYTLDTRLRIVRTSDLPLHKKLRSLLWNILQERRRRRALSLAEGVQINGTAAAAVYEKLGRNPLVYLDSRTTEDMYAGEAAMAARRARLLSGAPLRLAFSGRLEHLKGVDHLPRIAARLKERGIRFKLEIFGAGSLESAMARDIAAAGLDDCVSLAGNVDFETVLSVHMRDNIDLFICCHRQGDPSCTYLETLSCGVPIAGYANSAFAGILDRADCGWGVRIDAADELGDLIASLDARREEIADKAARGLRFAEDHSFEKTFKRRIDHLKSIAGLKA